MERTPVFRKQAKNRHPSDFRRHIWCPHYDICLSEAAVGDDHLDCGACGFIRFSIKEGCLEGDKS